MLGGAQPQACLQVSFFVGLQSYVTAPTVQWACSSNSINFAPPQLSTTSHAIAVKHYSPVTRLALIRVPGSHAGPIRAAIALIKQIRKKSAALHVLQVAGSLRTLQLYLAQWQGALTGAMRASAAADSVVLDKEFLDALDADLADAMPGKRKSRDGDAPASSSHAGKSGPNANERASANESGKKRKR